MPRTRMYKKQFSIFLPCQCARQTQRYPRTGRSRCARYLEWGATFVAVGSDLGVFPLPLRNWLIPLKNNHHRNKRMIDMTMKVGFIGLGIMGKPIVKTF